MSNEGGDTGHRGGRYGAAARFPGCNAAFVAAAAARLGYNNRPHTCTLYSNPSHRPARPADQYTLIHTIVSASPQFIKYIVNWK